MPRKKAPDIRNQAIRILRKAETVFLSGHERPDGDCLGSALALRLALRGLAAGPRITDSSARAGSEPEGASK